MLTACTWMSAMGQSLDSTVIRNDRELAELDSLLNSADSLSILDLIDSVILATPVPLSSQLAVRVGYNNNVVSSSTPGINQFGFNGGLSYYHKSGAYLDASTYYSNQYDPAWYLTVAVAGYLATINRYWSILAEYDHYFYTPAPTGTEVYTPYTNNVYLSNYFKVKKFVFRMDYNLFFGDLVSHRFAPAAGLNFTFKKWLGIDRITILPTASMWYGSDTVTDYVANFSTLLQRRLLILQGKPLFTERNTTVWGILNYTVALPVSVSHKNWSLMVSYNLNFLKGLPGESVESSRTGYLGVNLTRYFNL